MDLACLHCGWRSDHHCARFSFPRTVVAFGCLGTELRDRKNLPGRKMIFLGWKPDNAFDNIIIMTMYTSCWYKSSAFFAPLNCVVVWNAQAACDVCSFFHVLSRGMLPFISRRLQSRIQNSCGDKSTPLWLLFSLYPLRSGFYIFREAKGVLNSCWKKSRTHR